MKLFREKYDWYTGVAPKNTFDEDTGKPLKAGEPCWIVVGGNTGGMAYLRDPDMQIHTGFWFNILTFIGFGKKTMAKMVRKNQSPSDTPVITAIAMQKYLSACRNNPT